MACRPAQCSHSRPPGLCDRDHGRDGAGRVLLIDLSRRPIAKKVAADVLTRQPECSNRAIAEQVQLSKGTVQDVRRGLEASGQIG
jgi:hypothetical protein